MISEADEMDYKQQEGEEKYRAFLERRAMMGGPDAPEPCETCSGQDFAVVEWPWGCKECPRCLGTGVQP
ncbi:hypothetical protein LCGC14_0382560 [marine sediment metagenome]|uniref:Uncharacterized protein n=1 Tax=marine sediment metagenome TaxID=412755 RepID=A0A0F9TK17_9ZZZZ